MSEVSFITSSPYLHSGEQKHIQHIHTLLLPASQLPCFFTFWQASHFFFLTSTSPLSIFSHLLVFLSMAPDIYGGLSLIVSLSALPTLSLIHTQTTSFIPLKQMSHKTQQDVRSSFK